MARRPSSLWCTKTGQALTQASALDFDQTGGNGARTHTILDAAGRVFGAPTRRTEWDLALEWSQPTWGYDEDPRDSEAVTSVSVHRGVVVAASAAGRIGLFSTDDGAPRLARSLLFAGAPFDSTSREHALRLPIALRHGHLCAATERFALFRDLTPSLFPHAPLAADAGTQMLIDADEGLQWIGAPLVLSSTPDMAPTVVLATGAPQAAPAAPAEASLRFFTLGGTPCGRIDIPDLIRPPVEISPGHLVAVTALGHVLIIDAATQQIVLHALPDEMLRLSPTERPHLAFSDGPDGGELWLADDTAGVISVWRAPMARLRRGSFQWEDRFESGGLGTLFGLSVGPISPERSHPASEHFVLSTERSVAAYSRAMRHPAAEAVLSHAPRGPAVLSALGFFAQDDEGLWLRGLGDWSFRDDNLERRLRPAIARPPPSLYDRTFSVFGRQVFFATGNVVSGARLNPLFEAR